MFNLLFSFFFLSGAFASEIPLHLYHTNDLHSHLEGFKVPAQNAQKFEIRGGFDRLVAQIQEIKAQAFREQGISFGIDGGDFFAGTVFSALGPSPEADFPEYQFFLENGFELVTFGNHEFDALNKGLERMLEKVKLTGLPIVSSNMVIANPSSKLNPYVGSVIKDQLVTTFKSPKGNLKIGFLGILGPDGCLVSRATREDVQFIGFNEEKSKMELNVLAKHLQAKIDRLRNQDKVDIVILSMHGGGEEAHNLANALNGLDILIAGHTHKKEFEITNGTIVSQTGSYGDYLGYLQLVFDTETRKLKLANQNKEPYVAMDSSKAASPEWTKRIAEWRNKSLQIMGLSPNAADEVIFVPDQNYLKGREMFNRMGLFVTSAVQKELNVSQNANVDLYFTSAGLIRESLFKDVPYTQSDLFNIFSVGFDQHQKPGVEIVAFYLTPAEIKTLMNFLEIYSKFSGTFSPVISDSVTFDVRWWGIPFVNRVGNLKIRGQDIGEFKGLIKVATNSFVAKNIDTINKISYGLVSVIPKNEQGVPTQQFQTFPKEYEMLIAHFKRLKLDSKK